MSYAILSIIFLAGAIAIGFFRKLNVGLIAIMGAFIFGHIIGINDKKIISGFDANLFITLMGVTFLFSILSNNGSIELLAKKTVQLLGRKNWFIPIAIFIIGYVLTAIGPGSIPLLAIMPAFAIPVAITRGYNPLMMALIADFGAFAGRMSPITPEGILVRQLMEQAGLPVFNDFSIIFSCTVTGIVSSLVAFIYYKGYKVKEHKQTQEEKVHFEGKHILSLLGLLCMVIGVVAFKFNVGLVSFLVGVILLCLNVADEGQSIRGIPWAVLIMVCGVGTLMQLVVSTGGVKAMSNFLSTFMSGYTASMIMGITGGVMSWFSSGLGVVFPTLIPTAVEIANNVGGVTNPMELASAIVIGGTFTGVSPFSTTGGLILATLMTSVKNEGADNYNSENFETVNMDARKTYMELLVWAILTMAILAILAVCGVYRIF